MKSKLFVLGFFLSVLSFSQVSADQFRTIRDTSGKLEVSRNPAYTVQSLAAGTTIPNLSNGTILVTGINTGATAISGFSNAVTGNIVRIIGKSTTTSNATTIADSAPFYLAGAFTASANNSITILIRGASDYVELSRSAN